MSAGQMHPAYGLPDSVRIAALEDADRLGVQRAAELHKISLVSIYNWRKRVVLEETGK